MEIEEFEEEFEFELELQRSTTGVRGFALLFDKLDNDDGGVAFRFPILLARRLAVDKQVKQTMK